MPSLRFRFSSLRRFDRNDFRRRQRNKVREFYSVKHLRIIAFIFILRTFIGHLKRIGGFFCSSGTDRSPLSRFRN